jgi:hypothetical protein
MWSTPYYCQILIDYFRKIHRLHENLSSGSRAVPSGRTDGRTDKGNFVTAPKNGPVTATTDLLRIIITIIITSNSAPKHTPHCIQNLPKSLTPKVNGFGHEENKCLTPYLHYHFKPHAMVFNTWANLASTQIHIALSTQAEAPRRWNTSVSLIQLWCIKCEGTHLQAPYIH